MRLYSSHPVSADSPREPSRPENCPVPDVSDPRSREAETQTAGRAVDVQHDFSVPCQHCGAATVVRISNSAAEQVDEQRVFCCTGCRGAYQLIHGWGLEDFYALRANSRLSGASLVAGRGDRFKQFDSTEFLGKNRPQRNTDGSYTVELAIQGIHCGACSWLIENAALRLPGLLSARVRMSHHTIRLVYWPERQPLSEIARFLDQLGYQLAPFDPSRNDHVGLENRRLLAQIAIAGFLAMNAMWIAIALYAGQFTGVAEEHRYFLGLIGSTLGLAAVSIPGRTFFVGALSALKTRTPHMDLPVALGLSVGTAVGSWNALAGTGDVYFDSLATLVFLLLVGRWIQFRQQQRASHAVDMLLRLTPQHADIVRADGSIETVSVESLKEGDVVQVNAGDSVPADGDVIVGNSKLNRALLTGESTPVACAVGDKIDAGTLNIVSPIRIRVAATGAKSRIGRVMETVASALEEKTPIVLLADRIGGVFVFAVMGLAAIAFLYWFPAGLATATAHSTALLIVACPCALALATPLAIAVGLGRAAKRGILVRDGSALQHLARTGQIWFDKTGTLTEGKQAVTSTFGSTDDIVLASRLEQSFKHPIAEAIVRYAAVLGSPGTSVNVVSCCAVDGGIQGTFVDARSSHPRQMAVGNLRCMESLQIEVDAAFLSTELNCISNGETPIYISVDGRVTAMVGISDPTRASAVRAVERLVKQGWQVGILSGDHPEITCRVGCQLGIEAEKCLGGLSPEDKLSMIRASQSQGQIVAMVGDGVNDAAALAAADIGIAVRGGAEVSLQAAPVFLATGQLQSLNELVSGARRTTRLIWATFAISLSYNLCAVGLALAGWISPLAAAIVMPISSLSVLAVTLLSTTFKELDQ